MDKYKEIEHNATVMRSNNSSDEEVLAAATWIIENVKELANG